MPSAKDIRKQIRSIENTKKITSAMQMVAASKMRKAEARVQAIRPYAAKLREVIAHVGKAHPEYVHPFMRPRDPQTAGLVIITSDRGLCGGLNTHVLRRAVHLMQELQGEGIGYRVITIGRKGLPFIKRLGVDLIAEKSELPDAPEVADLVGPTRVVMDTFLEGGVDRVYLLYNRFINTMTQRVEAEQILPLPDIVTQAQLRWDYLYEPGPETVLDGLMERYLEWLVYHGVVENLASEQAARMVAMKNATDNAENLIEDLRLTYNKARQAAITQEIAEITSGAAALEG